MATAGEILDVRNNTAEPDSDSELDDEEIEALIDADGVDLASAVIWRRKAATYSEMVNVSEAGASRAMSDLFKNAVAMAEHFEKKGGLGAEDTTNARRAKVHLISRSGL